MVSDKHDVVLGRRGLKLEVELAAEALAQRQAPGAVDAAAIRRVDDQLHAAGFVEKALEDQRLSGGEDAKRPVRRVQILDNCSAAALSSPRSFSIQLRAASAGRSLSRRRSISARKRETDSESSSLRPGASPSQNGMVGGAPCASSTRTMPRSTRMMR